MSRNMTVLCLVAVAVGVFEAVAAATPDSSDAAARVVPGVWAALLLASAAVMWARRSVIAATVAGLLLLIDVAGVPFYGRTSWSDWVIQGAFAVVAVVGIVAWVNVLRSRSTVPVAASR